MDKKGKLMDSRPLYLLKRFILRNTGVYHVSDVDRA